MAISIRLTNDEVARLNSRSKSFYAKAALQEYLTDLEDTFAADSAIDAFETEGQRSLPAVGA